MHVPQAPIGMDLRGEALEHPFEVVVARGCLLFPFGAPDCVAHQEYPHRRTFDLGERQRKPQAVVGPFGAVGRVVEDQQCSHGRIIPLRPGYTDSRRSGAPWSHPDVSMTSSSPDPITPTIASATDSAG